MLAWLPRRAAAALGLIVLTSMVALVSQAPTDPYYAISLKAWEQGRFIRFHGLAQWIGWLWPYAAMLHLLAVAGEPSAPQRQCVKDRLTGAADGPIAKIGR